VQWSNPRIVHNDFHSWQIRLGFSYSDRPQYHSGLFSGLFKKFDKAAGVIQAKVARARIQMRQGRDFHRAGICSLRVVAYSCR
jgi:hypothetical protein